MASQTQTFLLLGEGDFTYSLDMCRYLASIANLPSTTHPGHSQGSSLPSPSMSSTSLASLASLAPRSNREDTKTSEEYTSQTKAREHVILRDTFCYSVTCTGVDTLEELREKYKDADFILNNIRQCSTVGLPSSVTDESGIKVNLVAQIVHGVNAVEVKKLEDAENNICVKPSEKIWIEGTIKGKTSNSTINPTAEPNLTTSDKYSDGCKDQGADPANVSHSLLSPNELRGFDHVLFHHPHLGTEDAQLHSRFLRHFFHAAVHRWLKPSSNYDGGIKNDEFKKTNGKNARDKDFENKSEICKNNRQEELGGLLYLTLVNGQCERWKCIEGAEKHGLVLLRRSPFSPPPAPIPRNPNNHDSANLDSNVVASTSPPSSNETDLTLASRTFYLPRRHQSGKSFANRRLPSDHFNKSCENASRGTGACVSESETLVFGRVCDYPLAMRRVDTVAGDDNNKSHTGYDKGPYGHLGLLPWESFQPARCNVTNAFSTSPSGDACMSLPTNEVNHKSSKNSFPCNYCSKSFQEQRSLKNHMVCCHSECDEVIAWKLEKKHRKKKTKKNAEKRSGVMSQDIEADNGGRCEADALSEGGESSKKRKLEAGDACEEAGQRSELMGVERGGAFDSDGDIGSVDGKVSFSGSSPDPKVGGSCKSALDRADNENGRPEKNHEEGPPWICSICESHRKQSHTTTQPIASEPRIFPHKQALMDHQRAKHFGNHLDIKPDWCRQNQNQASSDDAQTNYQGMPAFGSCPICDLQYTSDLDQVRHELEFVPSPAIAAASTHGIMTDKKSSVDSSTKPNADVTSQLRRMYSGSFQCQFCDREFRQLRAQQQHENFCSLRKGVE